MKKLFFAAMSLIVITTVCSCNDNEVNFTVLEHNLNHVLQMNDDEFKPAVMFVCGYGKGKLYPPQTKIFHDDVEIKGANYSTNSYEATEIYGSMSEARGKYTIHAVSSEGEAATGTVNVSLDKALGTIEVANLSYSNNTVSLTILEPVENATHYGIYVRPVAVDELNPSFLGNRWNTVAVTATSGPQNVSVNFDFDLLYFREESFESVMVYAAALRGSSTTTTLIRIGEGKLLKKGGTSFE